MKINYYLVILLLSCCSISCINDRTKTISNVEAGDIDTVKQVYKPFKSFDNDTMKYLKENFVDHKSYYLNKPLSVLIKQLEIRIDHAVPSSPKFEAKSKNVNFISLNFRKMGDKPNVDYYRKKGGVINIEFEQSFSYDSVLNILKNEPLTWSKGINAFFANRTVKNIETINEYYKDLK